MGSAMKRSCGRPAGSGRPVSERLAERLELDPETGCLNWTGPVGHNGYGSMGVGRACNPGSRHRVHRLAYELAKGPIPEDMVTDHLCKNRRCCNPDHLEAVTPAENTRRGNHTGWWYQQRTHCNNGHEYTPETTKVTGNQRRCLACVRERAAKRRAEARV